MVGGESGADGPKAPVSARLVFRRWRDSDLACFATLNADPKVARWLGEPLSRGQSDAVAERIRSHFEENGFGLWALECARSSDFLGFVGLARPAFEADFTPCVEVAWRLGREHWSCGYASEGGRACLEFGFQTLGLAEVVSFTAVGNTRSRAVMETHWHEGEGNV